jgi:signal transduction histidine kinase
MAEDKQEEKVDGDHLANLELFRTMIFDTIREPLVVLDTNLMILSANEAFYKRFFVNPKDTRNKLLFQIGNFQWDIPALRTLLERILPEKETIEDYEVSHEFPTIGRRTFLLNARQIHGAIFKNVPLILLVFDDITEKKSITDAIIRLNDELQASNDVFESFGDIISHDLRTPIRVIRGFCQLLLEDFSTTIKGDMREYVDKICSNASVLDSMVSGLLELSKLTRLPVTRMQTSLTEMVRDIASRLKEEEPERRVEFRIENGLGDNVAPNIIKVAVYNLIKNSFKFTREKSPAIIEFGAKQEENRRVYYVKDNGVGFDMDHSANLFRLFVKLHSDKKFKGTGIGLAVTKRAIEKHNGEIWAFSETGKGATFFFTINQSTMH